MDHNNFGVATEHKEYSRRKRQWTLIRDCLEGEDAIKMKGEVYLPKPRGYSKERYEAFKVRAEWDNYSRRVLTGLQGLVFRKKPTITYPDKLKPIIDNIDRRGTSLFRFASSTFKDSLPVTFGGLLVDMPPSTATTELEAEKDGIVPYFRYYSAESIINWKTINVNGVEKLGMIVLKETYEDEVIGNEFAHEEKIQYRVLDIMEGYYRVRVFKVDDRKPNEPEVKTIPVTIKGKQETEIPFFFFFENTPVTPYFLDLAKANISHYRKTADYNNGVHLTTIPTGWITGHEKTTFEDGSEEEVGLGEDEFLFIAEPDAKVGTLCYAGEGLTHAEKSIDVSMSNMAVLGSRLVVTEKGTSESADSAKIHRAGENASLADLANIFSDAITNALKTIARWQGIEGVVNFRLCTDYDTLSFDPNAINSIANLSREGKYPLPYIYATLNNGEYTPEGSTLEEYAILLDMERAGYTPFEIVQAFNQIRETGKFPKVIQKKNPVMINQDDPKNDENKPEDITTEK